MSEQGPDEFGEFLAQEERINKEMLRKYQKGQKVKVDDGEGRVIIGIIHDIYKDFSYGSLESVFIDLEDENDGGVYVRILAEDILEIIE